MLDLNSSTEGLGLLPEACVRNEPWGHRIKTGSDMENSMECAI